jgi:uncharacterized oxidoreductase
MPDVVRAPDELERLARRVFEAWGAPADVAATVAGHLVGANLAGHDSHGVIRIAQYAAEQEAGTLVPSARAEVIREREAIAIVDAGRGFGHHATAVAMAWCVKRCQETGIAAATVRRTNHIGRLGEYVEMAVAAGVVGIASVGIVGAGGVIPFGARKRFLGTNPWAIGVPGGESPFIFDAATSTLAEGKVRVARAKGAALPAGVLVDASGRPSTDPEAYYAGGGMVPLGGILAGHKGYGLALAAALLGALSMVDDESPSYAGTFGGEPYSENWLAGALTIAIDPAAFGDAARYRAMVAGSLAALRELPPAEGFSEVLVAGDVERQSRERRRTGIPIPERTWEEVTEVARRYGVAVG